MQLNSQVITEYLYEKFTDFKESNKEFMTNSLFVDDEKHHLSINKETGLWQDFKTGRRGNFFHLVSIVEGISYKVAEFYVARKIVKDPFSVLQFKKAYVQKFEKQSAETKSLNHYIKDFFLLKEEYRSFDEPIICEAFKFLDERRISLNQKNFYIAHNGRFINRLIIPFEENGKLIFFQGRSLTKYQKPKYLNPSSEEGVKASDILYPFNQTKPYIVLVEGVFDAISLQILGVNATSTNGVHISDQQLIQLKGKTVILGYDGDSAGKHGINRAYKQLINKGFKVRVISPPEPYKDWSEAYQNDFALKPYLESKIENHLEWLIRTTAVF